MIRVFNLKSILLFTICVLGVVSASPDTVRTPNNTQMQADLATIISNRELAQELQRSFVLFADQDLPIIMIAVQIFWAKTKVLEFFNTGFAGMTELSKQRTISEIEAELISFWLSNAEPAQSSTFYYLYEIISRPTWAGTIK